MDTTTLTATSDNPRREYQQAYYKQWRAIVGYSRTDATGVTRRVRALAAIGHTATTMAPHAQGISSQTLQQLMRGAYGQVESATRRRVLAMYEALCMTPGPSETARKRALAKGWVPPLAWDDDTIDDPKARPLVHARKHTGAIVDEVAVLRATEGDTSVPLTPAERAEAVRVLHSRGLNDRAIAARLGTTPETVLRVRRRLGLPALYDSGGHRINDREQAA